MGRRIAVIVAVVIVVGLISVLAIRTTTSDEPISQAANRVEVASPTPAPTPTVDPAIAWADDVCGATFGIRDTVLGVGDDLVIEPGAGALDTIRQRLANRGDSLVAQLEPLAVEVGKVPVDIPEALALAERLDGEITTLRASAERAQATLRTLSDSGDAVAFGLNLPPAIEAVRTTATAFGAVTDTVTTATDSQGDRLGSAFRASTACRALTSGAPRPTP